MKTICLVGVAAVLLSAGCARKQACPLDAVDLEVLLSRMTNVNVFAEMPLGYSFMESSYDRSGGNQDWVEYTQAEPSGRITVFEADGPGYISRIWIASYYADRWLFFFDDEPEPRIDIARNELFGEKFPFVAPLAGVSSGGRYCLLPIPFSKSIRIEIVPSDLKPHRNYYHINYTKLALPPEAVSSFPKTLSPTQSNMVESVNAALASQPDQQSRLIADLLESAEPQTLAPDEKCVFWLDEGKGLLEMFALRIDSLEPADIMYHELLRQLRLQIYWDGKKYPSVDVPLGDFFFNPLYLRAFSAMPLGQENHTFLSRFPMPYRRGARAELVNASEIPVTITAAARGNRNTSGNLSRYFHAKWSATATSGQPFQMLHEKASGHFIGAFVTAVGQDGSWNILEGDEFLYPDRGSQHPQLGTGLEDYFSGAYYYKSLFDLPLHGLIEKGAMRTDQYRLHLLEGVAFDDSIEFGFEFGHGNAARGYMSGISYWYGDKPIDQTLAAKQKRLLKRPADRFELPGLMTQLFLLEREKLFADAAARVRFFAKRYAHLPWVDVLKVRALGYQAMTEGFDAIKEDLQTLTESTFPHAARAAQDMLWLRNGSNRGLLGIHALAKYKLWLNGELVAEADGRNTLRVTRINVPDGENIWEVELEPNHQGSFFALCLRTTQGDITSAGEWETLDATPLPGREPPDSFKGGAVLPNMTIWAFEPNAYVNMQSPAIGVQLWSFWDSKPRVQAVRLRKSWSQQDLAPPPTEEGERTEAELRTHAID